MNTTKNKTALITGASRGFGFVIAEALAQKGWNLIINGRNAEKLLLAKRKLDKLTSVEAISGDMVDEIHLLQFPERIEEFGKLDLIVNNASMLGPSPLPSVLDYPIEKLHAVFHTNVIAPLSLLQKVRNHLTDHPTIINISSDAAVEAYEGWGGYGASKAALDHWTAIMAKENPNWRIFSFDPGDMRTDMHQEAFPGEDISDRPLPEEVALPGLLWLIFGEQESGRYQAKKLVAVAGAVAV